MWTPPVTNSWCDSRQLFPAPSGVGTRENVLLLSLSLLLSRALSRIKNKSPKSSLKTNLALKASERAHAWESEIEGAREGGRERGKARREREVEKGDWDQHEDCEQQFARVLRLHGLITLSVCVHNYIRSRRVCWCILGTSGSVTLQHHSKQTASPSCSSKENQSSHSPAAQRPPAQAGRPHHLALFTRPAVNL